MLMVSVSEFSCVVVTVTSAKLLAIFLSSFCSVLLIYSKLIFGNISMHGSWVFSLATSAT